MNRDFWLESCTRTSTSPGRCRPNSASTSMRPEGTEGWSEEQLASIVTRDTMIGVALPRADWTASQVPSQGARAQSRSRKP